MLASYRVGIRPHKHLFDVVLEIDGCEAEAIELWLPSWTPGSYLIREYARHVQDLRAANESGQQLAIERVAEDAWRLTPAGHSLVRVSYSVYAFDLTVRTSHLDESHAYFNGAALFLTCDALQAQPATLALDLPLDWRVETPLPQEGLRYRAASYDELCDSPVHCSPTDRAVDFLAAGVPHRLVMWGAGNEDLPALVKEITALVEQAARLFGGLPYRRYLFLALLSDRGRGGLEHRDGATLLSPRFGFRPDRARQEFLLLVAHELFHAWVVKRLRPRALLPYRYRAENFTKLLWFFEGFTSYYETLLTARAGLLSQARFLELWGERMTQLARTPGRWVQSLEEASLTAWTKYYRPDENSANSSVSYYLKGSLVALALEGELRGRGHSLDGLMQRLWARHGVDESGLPEEGLQREVAAWVGEALPNVFAAVSGHADPDYASLAAVGLVVRARPREGVADKGGIKPRAERDPGGYLGLSFKADRLTVSAVYADGPAERAGLCPEDEIVAADGYRLSPETCPSRLEQQPPHTQVTLTFFRREELRSTVLTLGERPLDTYWIEKLDGASEAQRHAYREWLGSEW